MQHISRSDFLPSQLAVLRAINRAGVSARVDLADATQLSTQSLTRITRDLIDRGFIVEGERRAGQRGQPAIFLSIASERLVSFGLVIEHDRITCIVTEVSGEEIVRLRRRGAFKRATAACAAAREVLHDAIAQTPENAAVLGLGVSRSGYFIEKESTRVIARNDPAGWRKVNMEAEFADLFGDNVFVENDGSAAAVGHAVNGLGADYGVFFLVLMTRGIGGGVVHNGRLFRGAVGNAGEISVLMQQDLNAVRPSQESLNQYLETHWGAAPTLARLEAGLKIRDAHLMQWLDLAAADLSSGLKAVTALLDPDAIILAGRLPMTIRDALRERIELIGPNWQNAPAPHPDILVDPREDCLEIGAASLPISHFFNGD